MDELTEALSALLEAERDAAKFGDAMSNVEQIRALQNFIATLDNRIDARARQIARELIRDPNEGLP